MYTVARSTGCSIYVDSGRYWHDRGLLIIILDHHTIAELNHKTNPVRHPDLEIHKSALVEK